MQNGYYTTVGAMVTQFNRLDVITNNLANVNTNAFKRDDVVVGDFKRIFQETQEEMPIKEQSKEDAEFINASTNRVPQVSEQYVEFIQGGLRATGNSLDFALKRSDTFFMVDTPAGVRLTQNGSFVIDNDGTLTTKQGYPVLSSTFFQDRKYIQVEPDSTFTVDKTGNIYSENLQDRFNKSKISLGRFFIAQSDNIKSLTKEGTNLYKFDDIKDFRDLQNTDVVAQGFLEVSNVNPVKEMVGLIEAQRMVEMYQKVMTSHMNDLNNDAINKLAKTRA